MLETLIKIAFVLLLFGPVVIYGISTLGGAFAALKGPDHAAEYFSDSSFPGVVESVEHYYRERERTVYRQKEGS